MAQVDGIGGVFILSEDAAALRDWYTKNLGVEMEAHPDGSGFYRVFETRDVHTRKLRGNPVFAINQAKGALAASGRGFTLNLRVDDLDAFLSELEARGIDREGETLEWERGKHAWIRDLDGNLIELYEELDVVS
jgi:catechol 2,3-dioxygenase-like lactoylglutathione lyase family enzyme